MTSQAKVYVAVIASFSEDGHLSQDASAGKMAVNITSKRSWMFAQQLR